MAAKEPEGRRRYVDMWALPGMHPSNVELLQKLKTADTNKFTTNMDCVGTVKEQDLESGKWEKSHLIGIRTDGDIDGVPGGKLPHGLVEALRLRVGHLCDAHEGVVSP